MKIPKGKTVYIRGKAYTGEVPDHLSKYLPDSLKPKPKTTNKAESKKEDK